MLLASIERFFQSFEAGPFMGAAPSALNPGQGDDQGRYCWPLLLPRDQLCVTQGIGRAMWSSHKVTSSCYRVAQKMRLPCSLKYILQRGYTVIVPRTNEVTSTSHKQQQDISKQVHSLYKDLIPS